jgi:tRNA G18 (ribose-2'-O)-methylase SpoU
MGEDSGLRRSSQPGEFYVLTGVGPHPQPWPIGTEFDPDLLANGDDRNVADEFRYLTVDAITAKLAARRIPVEIAIENWQHDLNIGALVRTANAFNVNRFHVIGQKHWNPNGAVGTYKYIDIKQHETVQDFKKYCQEFALPIIGFENSETSKPLEKTTLPLKCVLLLGNEGLGLTAEALAACDQLLEITQSGSVRSMNASAAGAIALYAWRTQHAVEN